jgi:hypothetical protein
MPPLPLNLDQISAARATLSEQRRTQRATSAELQRAKTELDALRRGAMPRLIRRAEAEVARLSESVKGSATAARESLRSISALSERLIRRRDPSVMVQALATTHPIALLPVAVQTRYDDATTKLMIRIYPDTLLGFTHEEGL